MQRGICSASAKSPLQSYLIVTQPRNGQITGNGSTVISSQQINQSQRSQRHPSQFLPATNRNQPTSHPYSKSRPSQVPSRQSCGATPQFSRPFDFNSITAPNQTHPSHPKPPSIPPSLSNTQKREADLRPPLKVKFQDS